MTSPLRNDVITIFTNAKKLPVGVKVFSDQPQFQRQYIKFLGDSVKIYNSKNPSDVLVVKHVKVTPMIVDSENKARDPQNLKIPHTGHF